MALIIFDFAGTLIVKGVLIPNLRKIVAALSKHYHLAIISSLETARVREYLSEENIVSSFSHILGGEQWNTKTDAILSLLKTYTTDQSHTVMITDTQQDIDDARKAGVHTIAVTWGYEQPTHASLVCTDPETLPELISSLVV